MQHIISFIVKEKILIHICAFVVELVLEAELALPLR
jgi:hypothetical protein